MINLIDTIQQNFENTTNKYFVEIEFNEDVLGGVPRTRELMAKFIESRLNREAKAAEKKGIAPPSEERKQELLTRHLDRLFSDTVDETIEAESERNHTTFFQDEHGPWIGEYQVKAMIREMMSCLGITMNKRGSKQTFQHLLTVRACDEEGNIVEGDQGLRLHFLRDGKVVSEVDGYVDKTAHLMTAQGPRSALKRHDKVVKASLRFALIVPAGLPKNRSTAILRDEEISKIFTHAQNDGLGCSRSQGHGSFKITRLERITDNPWVVAAA